MYFSLHLLAISYFLCVGFPSSTYSLNASSFQEGSCVPHEPQADINTTWLSEASLPYLSAGSRYHLYHIVSEYPQFSSMREFEFFYDTCLQSYVNTSTKEARLYGFGRGVIGNYELRATDQKGVIDFVQKSAPGKPDVSRHYVTLTDNQNFVFFSTCWERANQRGWSLISRTPIVDSDTQKLIEDHAAEEGFDRMQFMFLRYHNCEGYHELGNHQFSSALSSQDKIQSRGNCAT